MGKIIGIDLGTTNSLVSVWENGAGTLIPNGFGEYLTPSIVSFDADGTVYVGKVAKERQVTCPKDTVSVFKRFMGTSKTYCLAGKEYKPEELSALILQKLKEDAERYLQEKVEEAVISVPAYFNDLARNATKNAGKLAGLKVDRIINEPSAAALAYQNQSRAEDATILVFDFGGGTLDVSLVDCFDNVVEILAVGGDNRLGGSDFDQMIADAFLRENALDMQQLSEKQQAIVLEKAMLAKQELTDCEQITMHAILNEKRYEMKLDGGKLIEISAPLLSRMSIPIKRVLSDAQISMDAVSAVVLVGGSCKMPVVRKYVEHLLGRKDISVVNPDHMIAIGVGVYAGIKERREDIKDMMLTDICPFSFGVAVHNEAQPKRSLMDVLIERNTALPASREVTLYTVNDNQSGIKIRVFQGEELYVDDNLMLGSFEMSVPPKPKGKESLRLRYTYDINGILVVDATVVSTGLRRQVVIRNEQIRMTEQELDKKLEELKKLKIHPREKEENQILVERAARLYAETTGGMREDVERRARYFAYLLETQDEYRINRFRRQLKAFLDYTELFLVQVGEPDESVDDFREWYLSEAGSREEMEDRKAEEDSYEYWKNGYYTS